MAGRAAGGLMEGEPGRAAGVRPPEIPRATYRLQFNGDFRFDDARALVPYLAALGISHVYASPLMMARPGSPHGYDIVDHRRLNPEIGSEAQFDALVAELQRHGMGLIVDFVPNHMGIGTDNPWWMDVLEWGRGSPYAEYFDIDWMPLEPTLAGKVLLPVLGDHYGQVLARGEIQLRFDAAAGVFAIRCPAGDYPLAARDATALLREAVRLQPAGGPRLRPILEALEQALHGRIARGRRADSRQRVAEQRVRLAECVAAHPEVAHAVEAVVAGYRGVAGDPASFDALHRLLERQHYRLAYWRVAAQEINYRRFFDINELAGLRIENPELFDACHELVERWLRDGAVQGLRLDHVDGLRDPAAYFERLQRLAREARTPAEGAGGAGNGNGRRPAPLYLLVEKILAPHESLREGWAVSGTTGYEFMRDVSGVFIAPGGERALTRAYHRFIANAPDYEALLLDAKRSVMRQALASELNVLANAFNRLAKRSRRTRDYSMPALREALADTVAHFPVYRSYVTAKGVAAEDRRDIGWAVGRARAASHNPDLSVFDFVHEVLTLDALQTMRGELPRRAVMELAMRVQQYTGPVMAKAAEDTAFYRYVRLVSLNEVGSEPERFGVGVDAFHEAAERRLAAHPHNMLATATHDHKRGEDLRARLNVLSECPEAWTRRVRRWGQLNARKRGAAHGGPAPSRNDEYLFYQTVVGAWPPTLTADDGAGVAELAARVAEYMVKAAREAKLATSWLSPDGEYEAALTRFVERTLNPDLSAPFVQDIEAFVADIAPAGAVNALAQTLLKLTAPGVPDLYRGCEYWDHSLVDPDNRRPVDFAARAASLAAVAGPALPGAPRRPARAGAGTAGTAEGLTSLLHGWRDGRIKQWLIARTLAWRHRYPSVFTDGDYHRLVFSGREPERLLGYCRCADGHGILALVPRHVHAMVGADDLGVGDRLAGTRVHLPEGVSLPGEVHHVLREQTVRIDAGETLEVPAVLGAMPVALLGW